MSSFSSISPPPSPVYRFRRVRPGPGPWPLPRPSPSDAAFLFALGFLKRPWRRLHWLSPLATAVVMVTGQAAPMAWRRLPTVPADGYPALGLRGALLRPPPSWGTINGSNLEHCHCLVGAGGCLGSLQESRGSIRPARQLAGCAGIGGTSVTRDSCSMENSCKSGFPHVGRCSVQHIKDGRLLRVGN